MRARSLVHRSDTPFTLMYSYKNQFKIMQCVSISNNMADSWPLSINVESMGEFSFLKKLTLLSSMRKLAEGWRALAICVINLTKYCYVDWLIFLKNRIKF